MATLRKRQKLAALNKEKRKVHNKGNLAQNINVLRSQEGYIAQVSEEIDASTPSINDLITFPFSLMSVVLFCEFVENFL